MSGDSVLAELGFHRQQTPLDKFCYAAQTFVEGLTQRQAKEMKEAFHLFNKTGDGYLNKEQLKSVRLALGLPTKPQHLEACLKEADTDKDGRISKDEFDAWIDRQVVAKRDLQRQLQQFFLLLDNRKKGVVTPDDLQGAMDNLGETLSRDEVKDILDSADTNKDGVLDEEEFVKFLMDNI